MSILKTAQSRQIKVQSIKFHLLFSRLVSRTSFLFGVPDLDQGAVKKIMEARLGGGTDDVDVFARRSCPPLDGCLEVSEVS